MLPAHIPRTLGQKKKIPTLQVATDLRIYYVFTCYLIYCFAHPKVGESDMFIDGEDDDLYEGDEQHL